MRDVVAIGSITQDNFLEINYKIINWPKTPLKKAIILPLGEKLEVKRIIKTIGGNAANASVTFGRQNLKTACFGKIGNDLAGKEIFARIKKEKVESIFSVSKSAVSASSTLLLKNGERTILGYHGASDDLKLKDIPWKKLISRWWYVSLAGESYKFFKPLLNFAKKNKIQIAFNPSDYHIKHGKNEILNSLKNISFLVLNEGEAAELVDVPFYKEKEVFKKLDKLTPGIVAVTNGPRGVTVSDGKLIYKAGIFRENILVDRTGAGDAFGSAFCAGLIQKLKSQNIAKLQRSKKRIDSEKLQQAVEYSIRLATANATSVVEQVGATEGILTKKEFLSGKRFKILKIEKEIS